MVLTISRQRSRAIVVTAVGPSGTAQIGCSCRCSNHCSASTLVAAAVALNMVVEPDSLWRAADMQLIAGIECMLEVKGALVKELPHATTVQNNKQQPTTAHPSLPPPHIARCQSQSLCPQLWQSRLATKRPLSA